MHARSSLVINYMIFKLKNGYPPSTICPLLTLFPLIYTRLPWRSCSTLTWCFRCRLSASAFFIMFSVNFWLAFQSYRASVERSWQSRKHLWAHPSWDLVCLGKPSREKKRTIIWNHFNISTKVVCLNFVRTANKVTRRHKRITFILDSEISDAVRNQIKSVLRRIDMMDGPFISNAYAAAAPSTQSVDAQ